MPVGRMVGAKKSSWEMHRRGSIDVKTRFGSAESDNRVCDENKEILLRRADRLDESTR